MSVDPAQYSYWCSHVDASLLLLLEADVRRLLVESDAEPLQLFLDDPLVLQWLEDIQDNEDEATGSGHSYHLSPPPLAILGPLNDTR